MAGFELSSSFPPFLCPSSNPSYGSKERQPFWNSSCLRGLEKGSSSRSACLVHIRCLPWFRTCLCLPSPECVVQKVNSPLANDSMIFNVFNRCMGTAGISHPRHQKTSPICGPCVYHKKMLFRRMGCNLWLGGSIPRMGEVHQYPDHLAKLLRSWNQDGTFSVGKDIWNTFWIILILIRLKIPKHSLSVFYHWSLSPLSAEHINNKEELISL